MGHDSTDDRDEPSTQKARVLLTDGGSEAEQEASDESDENDESRDQEADEGQEQEETPAEPAQIEADDEAVAEQSGDAGVEPQENESTPSLDGEGDTASIIEIRNQVIELSTDVIGRGLDGIIEVSRDEDNWRAVVEIIERRSVPDTQDILGQYEIELDEQGEVIGYRRLEKYRRSDTGPSQH
ncbi:gas vesicle protein GvpO [Halohasta litorea]|uniref:Gas vesicle protein GvpO n=1 Tax=Halohasta litorea TaxID=869891 RepID=A0ABD6D537_9EURY|nr:gas vesicle protein GvpO [Halohasta litorea]MEA1931494.1 gas vesicle protein GvpO [Euryarchaeota archaeon]